MSRRNVFYGKPEKIYRSLDFICPYCYHQVLSQEELAQYTGGVVLTYADKSQAYTKLIDGVVDGVFVLYKRENRSVPAMRGRFEDGYAEGTWQFHKRVKGVWVDVEVDYYRGKVQDNPRVDPKSAISLLKMGQFRAPNLQKTMTFKIPPKRQCRWTRSSVLVAQNIHE